MGRGMGTEVLQGRRDAPHHPPGTAGMAAMARNRGHRCDGWRSGNMTPRTSRSPQSPAPTTASWAPGARFRGRPMTRLRTIDEAAELLNVSPRAVRRLIDSGALPAHRFGRAVRIGDEDIVVLLAANRSV